MSSNDVLVGTPSDEVPEILATARTDVTTIFVSMSARHPEGRDAAYIEWHGRDHEPEQHRLASLRASLRLVSTPACRAARAASDRRYDDVDHVMTYLFADLAALEAFNTLNVAMANAGRTPYLLPVVERGIYRLEGTLAAPRIKIGADVLPWWAPRGMYLIVQQGDVPGSDLIKVPGVAGLWWGAGVSMGAPYTTADQTGLKIAYCFLDGDPVEVADRLRPVLSELWADSELVPLLAAPFCTIVRNDWGRYVP